MYTYASHVDELLFNALDESLKNARIMSETGRLTITSTCFGKEGR